MNLHPDDPRLSAWVLGELPADEAAQVAAAVAADPALQAAAEELRGVSNFLSGTFSAPVLRPEQREAVRRAGRSTVVEFPVRKKQVAHWPALLATAAAIAVGGFLFSVVETSSDHEIPRNAKTTPGAPPTIRPATGNGDTVANRHVHSAEGAPDPVLADFANVKLPEAAKMPAIMPRHGAEDLDLPLVRPVASQIS